MVTEVQRSARNVLVVVLDDVGTDGLSAYGEHPDAPPTPVIDALAADGVLFRHAWASSVCSPSRAMLLTGRYQRRYGFGRNIEDVPFTLPDRERILPEVLAGAGLRSAAVGKWHLQAVDGPDALLDAPLLQGFEHHRGTVSNLSLVSLPVDDEVGYEHWEKADDGVRGFSDVYATEDTFADAEELVDALPEPWFLYVALHAGHAPVHAPPAPWDLLGVSPDDPPPALRRSMLAAADAGLGRLLEGLGEEVRARTVVVVVGDNGSAPEVTTPPFAPARAKGTMFEGGIRVPLIVSGPGVSVGESDALVHVVDLLPTLAELVGAKPDPDVILDGRSLVPQLRDPDAPGRDVLVTERLMTNGPPPWPHERYAVRDTRFKLVVEQGVESLFEPVVYDDGPDLLRTPLSDDAEDALDRLRDALEEHLSAVVYEPE